ncbi:hypothetical protein SAMN04488009_2601 [Maribacter sedimenticola]|uniref:Uncharacterized protein n=2 Tax=Maribacter sedimenticola TaxID=228956 RepID=A0ABY1SIH9_9FLAO|nr:hypothetical protein SAMN04488009_2601 [Maribacter sedimenticola]
MKKSLLKFLLSICILLTGIYSPLYGNYNIEHTSFHNIQQFQHAIANTQETVALHKTVLKNSFGDLDKAMAIEAIEIEEEESKQSHYQKDVEHQQASASFYLLAVLFLFSYFTNSSTQKKLFTFLPKANRRFVLYQVFRI